jgi:hypothetical protein
MRIPAFIVAVGLTSTAFAGAYLETTTGDPAAKQAGQVNKMWFDGGRMRTENGGRGEGAIAIFKDKAMYVLDPKTQSYRKIDKATVDQMAAKLADARKQMQAAMANMPPERRAMMEKMMGQMGGAAGAATEGPKRALTKTGRTETVAGIKCTVREASVGGEKVEELCAAPAGSVTGGGEMMKTLREVGEMLKAFTQSFGAGSKMDNDWRDMETVNGVPILTRDFSGGKVTSETRLAVARKESIPAGQFDVPAGYTEKQISFGPGSGNDE